MAQYDIDHIQLQNGDVCNLNATNIYNYLDKTGSGFALDARQGKALNDAKANASDIAIIIDGNQTTHTGGAAIGEFVLVRNSTISGITDGLYKAVQAIPANTAIDSTYLTAVDGGGLNAVVKSLNDNIENIITVDIIQEQTDNQGYIGKAKANDFIVLKAWCTSSDVLIFSYPANSSTEHGKAEWWFRAVNSTTLQPKASTQLTIYYAYIIK